MSLSKKREFEELKIAKSYYFYREEDLKKTIQDFTKELKGRAKIKIANHTMDLGEDEFIIKRKEIDKLNQKHYGDKLIKEKLK